MKYKIVYKATDKLLKEALNLDKQVFSKNDVGDFNTCKKWLKIEKNIYTFLVHENHCIGYINFARITDDCFNKFYDGKMKDYSLTENDILPFSKTESNRCHLISIVIAKEYRDSDAISALKEGFSRKIENMKQAGIIIDDVIVDCVSIDGVKFVIEQFNAKFVTNSFNGKIYYSSSIYQEKRIFPTISLELLSRKNLRKASLIQYQIFKNNWCGYCDLLQEVEDREKGLLQKQDLPQTYVIKWKNRCVGIIGLHLLPKHKNTIWLNWFGVLPKYRRQGIGTHALFKIISLARNLKFKEFRIVTYELWNSQAQHIYKKTMQTSEFYTNKQDWQYAIKRGRAMIFSSSLVDKRISKWNNKFVDLLSGEILHKNSIKKLKEDGLI